MREIFQCIEEEPEAKDMSRPVIESKLACPEVEKNDHNRSEC